jgi:hypothetical protein
MGTRLTGQHGQQIWAILPQIRTSVQGFNSKQLPNITTDSESNR